MSASPLIGLFAEARAEFARLLAELAPYGLTVDPATELREGEGLLCYYDLGDGHIHLSLPDPTRPLGAFAGILYRNLLGLADEAEFAALIRLQLPWLLAHELGHYFRHQCGRFGADLWFEEQVANQFASALTEHRLDPAAREALIGLLRRVLAHLGPQVGVSDLAAATFLDPIQALGAAGVLRRATVRSIEIVQELFGQSSEAILGIAPSISGALRGSLEQRRGAIDVFNDEYAAGLARYVYLQYGWMLLELQTPERPYVDGVARQHLGRSVELLGAPGRGNAASAEAITACYFAHVALRGRGGALSRYFFKRYRSLLLGQIEGALVAADRSALQVDLRCLIDDDDDDELGTLDALNFLAPPALRRLFPAALAAAGAPARPTWCFPDESDRRLFALAEGAADEAAATTLARLDQLALSDVYRGLSAELLVDLTAIMQRVHVSASDALIWQGSDNDDVFLIVVGGFEVRAIHGEGEVILGHLGPGDIAGELAFLRGEPRAATLRATCPSECLVLRAASLRVLAYEHPALPMRLARMLARQICTRPLTPTG